MSQNPTTSRRDTFLALARRFCLEQITPEIVGEGDLNRPRPPGIEVASGGGRRLAKDPTKGDELFSKGRFMMLDEDKKKERERESYVQALPGKRILLADDDPDLRALLAASLRRAGYAVLTGASGREVLNLFSSASLRAIPAPDVIVLDIRMPTHSGLELLVALRLAEWDVPVILITGFGDEITHARAKEFGAFELLDKPLRSAALLDAIKRALATTSAGKLNHD